MFDLDVEVRRWRARQERKSSLAAAELDELEDHLRALVDLELELMTVPSRRRAYALACARLGESAVLSREFAKAGTPRWRKLLIAGWAMLGASFFLPATVSRLTDSVASGYQVFRDTASEMSLVALPSLIFLLTIPTLWNVGFARGRWLRGLLGVTGGTLLALGVVYSLWGAAIITAWFGFDRFFIVDPASYATLGPGFWLWAGSFLVAAVAMHLRAHHLTPAQRAELSSVSGAGAFR